MANEPLDNQAKPRFGPSDCLLAIFRDCSRDPADAIKARLIHRLQTFLQHHRDDVGNETVGLAANCCREAVIWYYRILESNASRERSRLGIDDISVLLENDLFHCCLVACCLEISICSLCLSCDFPQVLHILSLAPYHFWKVIDLVLRAEVGLSYVVVRHLVRVEERVLESLAWARDSPLWGEIQANECQLPSCQQVIPASQIEDMTRSDAQTPGVGQSLGAVSRPQRSNALNLFARKVYSLMGKRLRKLCATLCIADELRLKIWTCFEHSLVHCTDLMVDRHLDQLLMCAIYIIAKLTNGEISFRHIMKCYKSQPLASKSVCRSVLISGRDRENCVTGNKGNGHHFLTPDMPSSHHLGPSEEKRGNLIYFYNQVYITKMEDFAKQFAPNPGAETPPLSPYPRQWKASPRRHRLSSNHPIYISPYNTEMTPPQTPRLCYYFNSSPPERLREINNMIRTGNRRGYVVPLGGDEEDEDGPSVKRLCMDDDSALQRRLRDVVDDRMTRKDRG